MKMKFKNFCGIFAENRLRLSRFRVNSLLHSACTIFATLFVTTTIILLASCSQDDDAYDNSEMYTLAEEMGTRSGGGDPGGGVPAPVNINVPDTVITEFHEMYFFPNSIFYSSGFQHSPFTAIDPSLYSGYYVEADLWVDMQKVDGVPTVCSFSYNPSVVSIAHILETIPGYDHNIAYDPEFTITDVYFQQDDSSILNRYILYATGYCTLYVGEDIPFTAYLPGRLYY